MSEWSEVALEDIAAPIDRPFAMGPFGSRIRKENYQESGVPVLRGGNLQGERFSDEGYVFLSQDKAREFSSSVAGPGDIVFVAQGGIGQVGLVPENTSFDRFILSQNLMKVTVDLAKADPAYVFYYFRSHRGQHEILSYANPTGVPCISRPLTSLKSFRLPVPPLPVQRAIANGLGTLDDKIELNRRMNRMLEAIARAIFKSWFIDFDPVIDNAILNGKPIPDEFSGRAVVRREILAQSNGVEGVASYRHLFPDSFQDSPLGKIPKGWEVKALDRVADFTNGAACQKYPADAGQPSLPVIKIRELGQGVSEQTDRVSVNVPDKHKADDGDVLFSWSGTLVCKIWTGGPCFVNQHVFKVTSEEYPRWFHFYWVKHHLDEFRGVAAGKATTMGHIKRSHLSEAMTLVPSPELLAAMTDVVEQLMDSWVRTMLESRMLEAIRDTLLPRLISGDLCIEQAEQDNKEVGG